MRILVGALVLLLVPAGLLGCEENLAPREPLDAPFSLYGVLSPDLDTQSVRIYPIEDVLSLGTQTQLDVAVNSTNLHTGERRMWQDTVLVDANGQHEYIYWSAFQAAFGHTYRVEARRRSDGATSYADVRIPPPVTVRTDDSRGVLLRIAVEGEGIRGLRPEAEYTVRAARTDAINLTPIRRYRLSYEGRKRQIEGGWEVTFNMVVDYYELVYRYTGEIGVGLPPCLGLSLHSLELSMLVGDAVWDPPGGLFDPDPLSFPQILHNVENGFGFIGGGYRIEQSVFPSEEAVTAACFVYAL